MSTLVPTRTTICYMQWPQPSLLTLNLILWDAAIIGSSRGFHGWGVVGSARLGSDRVGSDRVTVGRVGSGRVRTTHCANELRWRFTHIFQTLPLWPTLLHISRRQEIWRHDTSEMYRTKNRMAQVLQKAFLKRRTAYRPLFVGQASRGIDPSTQKTLFSLSQSATLIARSTRSWRVKFKQKNLTCPRVSDNICTRRVSPANGRETPCELHFRLVNSVQSPFSSKFKLKF